jgi:hypothetical protein
LSSLVGLEFIDEECERSSYSHWKKYTYTPADDGRKILEELRNTPEYNKIKDIIEKCRENSNFDLCILGAAAKIHYIFEKERRKMTVKQISEKTKNFGWKINEQKRRKAVDLLKVLGLVNLN